MLKKISQAGTAMQNTMPGTRYSKVPVLPKRKKKELSSHLLSLSFILIPQIAFVLKIVAWTEKMVHKHPDMVSRIKIGATIENNPLYVLKVKIIQKLLILIIVEKHEF